MAERHIFDGYLEDCIRTLGTSLPNTLSTTGAMTAVDQRPPAAALRGYALAIVAMEIAPRLGTASVPPDPPALSTKRALALLS